MILFKWDRKRIGAILGICWLTGSLCACGDDTEATVGVIKLEPQPIVIEGAVAQENGTDAAEAQGTSTQGNGTEGAEAQGASTQGNGTEGNGTQGAEVQGASAQGNGTQGAEAQGASTQGNGTQGSASHPANTQPSALPTPPREVSLTISAAGDVTLGGYPEQGYYSSLPQAYDEEGAEYFFENVIDIFSKDDMTLINLEGVFTTSDNRRAGQTYSIKGEPEYVKILKEGSVETVSMANNHRMDYQKQGSDDTVALLQQENITYAYDENIGIYETQGIRIGYVAVNEVSEGVAVEKYLEEGIQKLKEEQVNLIIACCHWGIEREYYPESYQKVLGRKCIDWGADLVLGHHPHVLQGIEEYEGKYIVYSLGNFCFGANRNPDDKDSMIFQQTFTFINGQKQEDAQIQIIPCFVSSVSNRNDFKPTPATGEDAKRIIDKLNKGSKDFGVQFDENGKLIQ